MSTSMISSRYWAWYALALVAALDATAIVVGFVLFATPPALFARIPRSVFGATAGLLAVGTLVAGAVARLWVQPSPTR